MADNKDQSRGLSVKVDIDMSEALTGLKALQREAKKATAALKEAESHAPFISLSTFSTKELHAELARREGGAWR